MEKKQSKQPLLQEGYQEIQLQPLSPPNTVKCGHCQMLLKYPTEAYCVKCPSCSTLTATQPVSQVTCSACNTSLVYPANARQVSCFCGSIINT